MGHSLLSAVDAVAAALWGPEGERPNLYGDLRGSCLSAPGSYRDRLARRPHGNDTAPLWGRKLDRRQEAAAGIGPSLPQWNSVPSAHMSKSTVEPGDGYHPGDLG